VGPWQHYPAASAPDPGATDNPGRIDIDQLAWFDAHLRGGGGASGRGIEIHWTGATGWEALPEWPPPTRALRLHLRSRGRANGAAGDGLLSPGSPGPSEPPDVFVYDPAWPVAVPDANPPGYPMLIPLGPADQAAVEASRGVLVYTADPLEEPLAVAGRPTVRLETMTTADDTDWVVTMCDVEPATGRSVNVARGIVRARSMSGGRSVASEQMTHEIMLPPVGHVFATGHRIRLQVTSSAFPTWEPNPNTGHPLGVDGPADLVVATQTLIHDAAAPSWLELPCRE
jgi:putative CocE/NonD family hydrolase